tara:strand:+ start:2256 stop:3308 length:1053 start_codon:yes stop_codon:yes gene_type:complete
MKLIKKIINNINGKEIFLLKFINNNNYSIEFCNYGGYFFNINIPYKKDLSKSEDVLLGYSNLDHYIHDNLYLNSIVGRYCNRISHANFKLNNSSYNLYPNLKPHHIHGGLNGFNKKIWSIDRIEKNKNYISCVLSYLSKHMEEGYPGNLKCYSTYILNNDNELIINFNAKSDHDTVVNITNHNYWNFHGHYSSYNDIKDHHIKINANKYCETDLDSIPTGKLIKVNNSKYDFENFKNINDHILDNKGIDKCFCINDFDGKIKEIATAFSNLTKMGIIMYSNKPGLQFYTGNNISNNLKGKYNRFYHKNYGFCLESQFFPNSINHDNFISPILLKNDLYESNIVIKLKNDF